MQLCEEGGHMAEFWLTKDKLGSHVLNALKFCNLVLVIWNFMNSPVIILKGQCH